jgi:hypothetical protein
MAYFVSPEALGVRRGEDDSTLSSVGVRTGEDREASAVSVLLSVTDNDGKLS